ncbi:aspartate/glutamate racemase family protein [Salegentibacter salegens]|uniref:Aspartate racemase n=1 Tax=Salegentibacter salegens TaxID=143223 RepID=A0A1M7KBW3_9FLAO|nr:amino acid racemase [Salegentibacter salegens]PRX44366.1 aspartate racemase [Salegentibacter salegens]SHM62724.1 aspartate racemase [Salegentibacter salegens]
MNLLGMIGGTSWHSTIEYYRLLNELVGEEIGKQQNPPLLLYSLNVKLMRENDPEKIKNSYLEIAQKLENAGARAIIICANTPHLVYDFVQPKIDIPILHIADAIAKEAKQKGFKKLGLLGTKPTMKGSFLHGRLAEKHQIETLVPAQEHIDETHRFISEELTQGKFTDAAKDFYLEQMQLLKDRGAEAIILGCTELPMLIKEKDTKIPILDTTQLHAQLATEFILKGNN